MNDGEYNYIKSKVKALTTIDLDNYKEQQMRRRLSGFLERNKVADAESYFKLAEADEEMLGQLKDFLTINVSSFYRDDNQFRQLEAVILPELLRNNARLNIWSAGCSIGAEAYSLTIILEKLTPGQRHRIVATDIDDTIVKHASSGGPYSAADVKNVPSDLLARYFSESNSQYWVVDDIRKRVEFKRHNLLSDPYEGGFDLIVCRNVVIYFTDEAKRKINQGFCNSLKGKGVLFVGGSEIIFESSKLGLETVSPSFYRKSEGNSGRNAKASGGSRMSDRQRRT